MALTELPVYIQTLSTAEQHHVGNNYSIPAVAAFGDSIWTGAPPPDTNPLAADQADGTTSGVVRLDRDRPLARIGTTRRFALSDPAPLRSSIPPNWGDSDSYEYILKGAAGERVDPLMTGWAVRRDQGVVEIRSVSLLERGPFTLTYYAYTDTTAARSASSTGTDSPQVVQSGHGFAVGDAVRISAGSWGKASASADGSLLATHIVSAVASATTFEVRATGWLTLPAHGLGAPGTDIYLATTAGQYGAVAPPAVLVQRVARVLTADTLDVFLGAAAGAAAAPERFHVAYPGSKTAADPGGALTLEEIGLASYYRWTRAGGAAATAVVTKEHAVPPRAYAVSAGGVQVAVHTTTTDPADAQITLTMYDAGGGVLATASGTSQTPGVPRQLTLPGIPTTFAPAAGVRFTVTLLAANGETASAGPLVVTWLARDG